MTNPEKPNTESDVLLNLKNIAYRISQPPSTFSDAGLADLVNYAKFQICEARGWLFYDKIWDEYSDEQVITEYFAIRFSSDASFRRAFELNRDGITLGAATDWMDAEIAKNQTALSQYVKDSAGEFSEFEDTPNSLTRETDDGLFD